jgi:hypothetical protein
MNPKFDLSGKRFGRLVALEFSHKDARWNRVWSCVCDCGSSVKARSVDLSTGNTQSCGCLRKDRIVKVNSRHGQRRSRAYSIWSSMRTRCLNPKHARYGRYGGRGIQCCERWASFANFYADMGDPPAGRSLDRINNDGNYEPGNCRWATATEQYHNSSRRGMAASGM